MSKLTCKDVGAMSASKAVAVAMWMNGYVHGKQGNPKVDGDKAEANAAKVAAYCQEEVPMPRWRRRWRRSPISNSPYPTAAAAGNGGEANVG